MYIQEFINVSKKNGSIEYSSNPCPQNTKQQNIKHIKSINNLTVKKKNKVLFKDIKKASEGLMHIRLDGFGDFSLKDLKRQFNEGKKINKKVNLVKNKHWGSHFYQIETGPNKYINIFYSVSGMNYKIYDNPAKQRQENGDDKLASFIDITMKDVNDHAVSIGLKRKKVYSSGLAGDLSWKWKSEGFNCQLEASIFRWVTPHDLLYSCSYEVSE